MLAPLLIQGAKVVMMSAGQKVASSVATKVATSAASTFVAVKFQNKIVANENKKLSTLEVVTQDDVKKATNRMIGKSALSAGLCSGAGLVAFKVIDNAIQNS